MHVPTPTSWTNYRPSHTSEHPAVWRCWYRWWHRSTTAERAKRNWYNRSLSRILSFEDSSTIQQEDNGSECGHRKPSLEAIPEPNDGRGVVSLLLSLGTTFLCKQTAPQSNEVSIIIDKLRVSWTMRATSTSVVAMMAWPRRRQAREMCAPCIVCCRSSSGPCSGNFQQCFGLVLERGSWTRVGWTRGTRGRGGRPSNRLPGARDSTRSRLLTLQGCITKLGQPTVYFTTKLNADLYMQLLAKKGSILYSLNYVWD